MASAKSAPHPLLLLDETETEFVLRLVLASGSLKELAARYGVSYPTIRGRLDKLIAKLQRIEAGRAAEPMGELLATLLERGELTVGAAQAIRKLHRDQAPERIQK
ncbi:MAG TPA: DUF2089 family protein [Planctomycetota bacterium]